MRSISGLIDKLEQKKTITIAEAHGRVHFIYSWLIESFLNKFRKQLSQLEIHVLMFQTRPQSSSERDQSLSINHLTVHATVSITMSFRTLLSDQGRRQKGNGRGRRKEGEKVLHPRPQIFTYHCELSEAYNPGQSWLVTGQVARKSSCLKPESCGPKFLVKSPKILIKSVCNISRSLSDIETKQAG